MSLQTAVVSGLVLQVLSVAFHANALQPTRHVRHARFKGGVCKGRLSPGTVMSKYRVSLKKIFKKENKLIVYY